jgi:DNA-binding IclR family transcriptional regulator
VLLWFAKIERDAIARGVFTSLADLRRKLNKAPKTVKRYFDSILRVKLLNYSRFSRYSLTAHELAFSPYSPRIVPPRS